MKIIYNIRSTANSGGMERILNIKANWLVNAGYEVVIITTDQQGKPSFFDFDCRIKFIDLGINYRSYGDNIPYKTLIPLHKERLKNILIEEKADICISMFCEDVDMLPEIEDGSKKIMEFHFSKRGQATNNPIRRIIHAYRGRKMERAADKYDITVLLTEKDASEWHIHNKIVIPNCVILRGPSPATLDSKTVIAVGRYSYEKGFDNLLTAWSLIPKHYIYDGWKLRIIGSGDLVNTYRTLANKLNIADSVILGKAEINLAVTYQSASIMAATSRYEGWGLAIAEAQSFGIPVVSFDCNCGPSEIIDDNETGILVKPGDIKDLANQLCMLMDNGSLRNDMGRKAYERSIRFAPENIMKKWVNLFDELTGNKFNNNITNG